MDPGQLRLFTPGELFSDGKPGSTREWAGRVHAKLNDSLPPDARAGLTTDGLAPDGSGAMDVCRHFGLNPDRLGGLMFNMSGVICSAQMVDDAEGPEAAAAADAAGDWPGFHSVEVPVDSRLSLSGQMARQPADRKRAGAGDFVIIVHGLFGNMAEFRYHDLAEALNRQGFGVLALDMRGHGRTGRRHPDCPMTFGFLEPGDLRMAANWLRRNHDAGRIGLVGFSMGGYQSLLAAWQDSGRTPEPDPMSRLIGSEADQRPCFDGGVVAISPLIDSEGLATHLSAEVSFWRDPVRWSFQNRVRRRMVDLGSAAPSGSMWDLFEYELGRSPLAVRFQNRRTFRETGLAGVSLRGAGWADGIAKMESIRTPVLVLHAANDPLTPAQMVVELASRVSNPNLGVIVLPAGGHTGFPALSTAYYYNLILNFFDPQAGPRPAPRRDALPAQASAAGR